MNLFPSYWRRQVTATSRFTGCRKCIANSSREFIVFIISRRLLWSAEDRIGAPQKCRRSKINTPRLPEAPWQVHNGRVQRPTSLCEVVLYDAVFINGRRRYNFRVRSRGSGEERLRVLISTGTPPCSPFPLRSSASPAIPFAKNIPQDTAIFSPAFARLFPLVAHLTNGIRSDRYLEAPVGTILRLQTWYRRTFKRCSEDKKWFLINFP